MEVVGLMLCFFAVTAVAQPGFTSIDCGGSEDFTSTNDISWVTDAGFVYSGAISSINETDLATTLQTLRYFSNTTSSSNCYYIPVVGKRRYVLRASYYYGNYDGQSFWPTFSSYVDGYLWTQVSGETNYSYLYEAIWTTTSDTLTVCFMSSDSQNVPFISALAIRLLPNGSYSKFDLGDIPFYRLIRRNLGAYQLLRYPDDAYDRSWYVQESSRMINTTKNISTDGFSDGPPPLMFQSADEGPSNLTSLSYSWNLASSVSALFAKLYFWDFRERVQNASCMFNQTITIDGKVQDMLNDTLTLDPEQALRYSLYIPNLPSTFTLGITFTPLANSTLPPLLNGIEVYGVGLQSEQPQSPPPPTLSASPPPSSSPPPPSPPLSPRIVATSAALHTPVNSILILACFFCIFIWTIL